MHAVASPAGLLSSILLEEPLLLAWIPRATVHLAGPTSSVDGAALAASRAGRTDTPIATARIGGDHGGDATVLLDGSVQPSADGGAFGTIRTTGVPVAGKYDGTLLLDPTSRTSRSVSISVNAEDWVLWPLLAILGGAWAGWRLLRYNDRDRPIGVLRAALTQAAETYTVEDQKRGQAAPSRASLPYDLDTVLPYAAAQVQNCWSCPPRKPSTAKDASAAQQRGATEAEKLYCALASQDQQELAKSSERVTEMGVRVKIWLRPAAPGTRCSDRLRPSADCRRRSRSASRGTSMRHRSSRTRWTS